MNNVATIKSALKDMLAEIKQLWRAGTSLANNQNILEDRIAVIERNSDVDQDWHDVQSKINEGVVECLKKLAERQKWSAQ